MKTLAQYCSTGGNTQFVAEKIASAIGIDKFEHTAVLTDPNDRPSGENDEKIKAFSSALMGENDDKIEEQ